MHPQAQSIFEEAIGKSEQEREAFVTLACTASSELLAEVKALLQAHQKVRSFLSEPTGGGKLAAEGRTGAATLVAAVHEGPGTKIGHYKLLQQIGEGGFGVVFLAEQEQPVRRRVALKIIKLGMDTRQVVARFEAERQALALMDHPNIAKVLDAGATESGRPYFVMELVKGDPITDYCDTNNLDTEQRLDLFIQICHAVQHAHTKGIIHRDIKPSNVLVTIADGNPIPKVIDFGIAKATAARLTEKTLFTEHKALIGTPEYMSPEQAEMSGVDIDTRSDIYSLGVLLYELLTGTTPFDSEKLRSAAFGEIQRIIREQEPEKPSTRLSTMQDAIAGVAAHRRTEPARLTKLVRGDLDWIVMKALEKDRTRRYETANNLADDVQRHLSGEPVIAAPPSTAYRVKKFVRRHRVGVAAWIAITSTLIMGVVGTSLGMLWVMRAEAEQRRLRTQAEVAWASEAEQRKHAEAQQAKARTVTEYIQNMLGSADPHTTSKGPDYTVRQMLDEVAARLGAQLMGEPEIESAVRLTIARAYRELGRLDVAGEQADRALALARQATNDVAAADALMTIANVRHDLSDYVGAERAIREAHAILLLRFGEGSQQAAGSLATLADDLRHQRRFDEAEPLARRALETQRQLLGDENVEVSIACDILGMLLWDRGDLGAAEPLLRESVTIRRRSGDGNDLGLGTALNNLGIVLQARGNLDEAEPLLRESLELSQRVFPGDHPDVATSMHNLASLLQARGEWEKAEQLYRDALAMQRRLFAGDHPNVANGLRNLAALLCERDELDEATQLDREALAMLRRLHAGDHPDIASCLSDLAWLLETRGNTKEAETLYVEALSMTRRMFPGDQTQVAKAIMDLAMLFQTQGRFDEAEPLWLEVLAIRRNSPVGEDRELAAVINNLGAARVRQGDYSGAAAYYREALAINRRLLPAGSAALANETGRLTYTLLTMNSPEAAAEAEPLLRESLDIRRREYPDGHPDVWRRFIAMNALGGALLGEAQDLNMSTDARIAKLREAEPLVIDGYNGMKDATGVPAASQAVAGADYKREALERIVRLYELWKDLEPERGYQQQAQEWRRRLEASP